jgi:PAS domain S-box-containing protein
MSESYAYTPSIWPTAIMILFLIVMTVYARRRRSVPGAVPFMVACLFSVLAASSLLMTNLAVDPDTKIFWFRLVASSLLPSSTAITCFVLEYAWPGRWLTRRNLILLSILPLLGIFYFLTAGYLIQPMPDFQVGETVKASISPASAIVLAYMLALTLVNLIVLAWLFIRSPRHRWPVALMAASQIAMRVVFLGEWPLIGAQVYAIPVFALPFLAYAIALFGFRIFDPIPMARRTAIEQLHAGMLVLDPQERVVSLNPAGERILGVHEKQAKGRPVKEFLLAYPEGQSAETGGSEIEIHHAGQELRHYSLSISPLRDWRGLEAGRLLLLHDVTERRRAQAQIVEQQRELATLGERERMARDLHDNLGQVLGYAGIQVDAAAKLSRDGQGSAAAAHLDRLGTVIRDAHADVRQHILDLRSAPSLQQPFFTVVKQYLGGFTSNYDIHTDLTVGQELDEAPFAPDAQLQIFRILQEALSNVRKHSRAHHVQVTFSGEGKQVCMIIQDDGCGFQPEDGAMAGSMQFGLQSMQERAGQIGGSLQFQSTPGAGTRVVLEASGKEL